METNIHMHYQETKDAPEISSDNEGIWNIENEDEDRAVKEGLPW